MLPSHHPSLLNRLVTREFAAGLEGVDANETRDVDAMRCTIEQMAEAMENGAVPGGPLCRAAAVKKHDPRLAVVISGLEDLQVIADYAVDESVFLGDPP
jgi:hypothetical protein